jgi:hypothetical protein
MPDFQSPPGDIDRAGDVSHQANTVDVAGENAGYNQTVVTEQFEVDMEIVGFYVEAMMHSRQDFGQEVPPKQRTVEYQLSTRSSFATDRDPGIYTERRITSVDSVSWSDDSRTVSAATAGETGKHAFWVDPDDLDSDVVSELAAGNDVNLHIELVNDAVPSTGSQDVDVLLTTWYNKLSNPGEVTL